MLEQAAESLDEPLTVVDLRSACNADGSADSNVLQISCSFGSEKLALQTVDAIADAYRQQSKAQTDADAATALSALETERSNIETQVEEIRASGATEDGISSAIAASIGDRLTSLEERSTEIRTTAALFGDGTEFYDPARIPGTQSATVILARNALIGAFIGAMAAVVIAWFRADRSPVVERGDDVANALGLLMLGEVRHSRSDSGVLDIFESPDREFQLLASNLDAVLEGGLALFSSPTAISNHAEIVISVALVASHSGKRVLLIDADTHNRSISSALGTSHSAGFCDMLTGEASPEQVTSRIALSASPGMDAAELFLMGPGTAPHDVSALFRTPPQPGGSRIPLRPVRPGDHRCSADVEFCGDRQPGPRRGRHGDHGRGRNHQGRHRDHAAPVVLRGSRGDRLRAGRRWPRMTRPTVPV